MVTFEGATRTLSEQHRLTPGEPTSGCEVQEGTVFFADDLAFLLLIADRNRQQVPVPYM